MKKAEKQIGFRVTEDLFNWVQAKCKENQTTVSKVLVQTIEQWRELDAIPNTLQTLESQESLTTLNTLNERLEVLEVEVEQLKKLVAGDARFAKVPKVRNRVKDVEIPSEACRHIPTPIGNQITPDRNSQAYLEALRSTGYDIDNPITATEAIKLSGLSKSEFYRRRENASLNAYGIAYCMKSITNRKTTYLYFKTKKE